MVECELKCSLHSVQLVPLSGKEILMLDFKMLDNIV